MPQRGAASVPVRSTATADARAIRGTALGADTFIAPQDIRTGDRNLSVANDSDFHDAPILRKHLATGLMKRFEPCSRLSKQGSVTPCLAHSPRYARQKNTVPNPPLWAFHACVADSLVCSGRLPMCPYIHTVDNLSGTTGSIPDLRRTFVSLNRSYASSQTDAGRGNENRTPE